MSRFYRKISNVIPRVYVRSFAGVSFPNIFPPLPVTFFYPSPWKLSFAYLSIFIFQYNLPLILEDYWLRGGGGGGQRTFIQGGYTEDINRLKFSRAEE